MNNKCKFLIVFFLILMVATTQVQAEKTKGVVIKKSPKAATACLKPSQVTELALNNVRALLKTNGTMWFVERAEYEIPKGSGKTSLFSASLWIGGWSLPNNQGALHLAAMRFGQKGNDYWTGPLSMKEASIDPPSCSYYDKFYRMTRIDVERHRSAMIEGDPNYTIPKEILEWPAHGRSAYGESRYLAPFFDEDKDGIYDPEKGDYPYYDFDNELCPWTPENLLRAKQPPWRNAQGDVDPLGTVHNPDALPKPLERIETRQNSDFGWDNMMIFADHVLKGDETVFWFLNDKGGTHSETTGNAIGIEMRVQAFAFATNDELNKMTFYSYEIINRGSFTLYDTYFSQWCDPDLGYGWDDFVGCDVGRGLGYCYNGYEKDGAGQYEAYDENPPAVGLDFFQGPYIDHDGADNPKFESGRANANGNDDEKEYCRRFVNHIFNNFDGNDPNVLNQTYILPGTSDTIPWNVIRWNDQFAINGVNFGDDIVDNERFGMRAFTYHNNVSGGAQSDPEVALQYYYYLTGRWRDGVRFSYGSDAYSADAGVLDCNFVFPEGSDYCNWGTKGLEPGDAFNKGARTGNWSERRPEGNNSASPNDPNDRRFMQSAGPFTLRQGACNYITVGIPWARATKGGVDASIALLMVADDKCQTLFENCFKMLDGPDAPQLTIREYDQKLILLLSNSPLSNNAKEDYIERDLRIPEYRIEIRDSIEVLGGDTVVLIPGNIKDTIWYDRYYRFEGYQIFQVTGPDVTADDLENPDKARIIRQFDVVNFDENGTPVGDLINWEYNETTQTSAPVEKVSGGNTGIEHSFEVTQDVFATGSRQIVNYKTYYFVAVAYAYNQYLPFAIDPDEPLLLSGQMEPYLRGRKTAEGKSVMPISAIPHPPVVHGGGATLNSDYGSIPYITRIDGQGNGGIALDLMPEVIEKIVLGGDNGDYRVRELKYAKDAGPLNIKVIDPLRVKPFDYTIVIKDPIMDNDSTATIADKNRNDVSGESYWVLYIDQTVSDQELIDAGLVNNNDEPIREIVSQAPIGQYYEQIIFPLGLSIGIANKDFTTTDPKVLKSTSQQKLTAAYDPYRLKYQFYQTEKIDVANDVIYENNGDPWITGLVDDNINLPSNWIRAGSYNFGIWSTSNGQPVKGHFDQERLEDFHFPSPLISDPKQGESDPEERAFKDYSGKFGSVCNGTWAPYVLSSPYDHGPQIKFTIPEAVPAPENNYEQSLWDAGGTGLGPNIYFNFKRIDKYESQLGYNQTMTNLYSVNVVLTPDKSKWTRCIVLEACQDANLSEGGALKGEPRKHTSVKKDGTPDYDSKDGFGADGTEGMGWFPGYAINLETGERLNIMFSENSDFSLHDEFGELINGNDMIFNPTSTYAINRYDLDFGNFFWAAGTPIPKELYDNLYETLGAAELLTMGIERIWGGMHYVYVCNSAGNTAPAPYITRSIPALHPDYKNLLLPSRRNFNLMDTVFTINLGTQNTQYNLTWGGNDGYLDAEKKYPFFDCGPYDEGRWLVQKFKHFLDYKADGTDGGANMLFRKHSKMQLFNNVMYTHIPMQSADPAMREKWLSCDVTYKIRVTRPYLRYISRWYEDPALRDNDYSVPAEYAQFKGYPIYQLSTRELAPTLHDTQLYQSILDDINIVPNPYYGKSLYETNIIDYMVKITNLPSDLKSNAPVTINIYTVNGTLVRTLTKGDSETAYVNWDLKNYANIPIASGVYIIHVNCPGIGERMLKFFCVMRQIDLNTF